MIRTWFRAGINFSRDRNVPWKNVPWVLLVGKKTPPPSPSLISMLLQFLMANFSNCFIEQTFVFTCKWIWIFSRSDTGKYILERGVYFCNNAISRPRLRTPCLFFYLYRVVGALTTAILSSIVIFTTFTPFNIQGRNIIGWNLQGGDVLINVEAHLHIQSRDRLAWKSILYASLINTRLPLFMQIKRVQICNKKYVNNMVNYARCIHIFHTYYMYIWQVILLCYLYVS